MKRIDQLASGTIKADELITKKIGMNEIIEGGFETLVKEKNHVIILVSPRE
ncbi:hypothetical protein [Effusibacillus lacus]|uniref:Butanediol dehydrogenase n=1 Tax=Effusibacillus lacus TaxID=1348429 RepID=A0A292YKR1_9BACL|nr:hypothetical protein [Effusibacillus lacus]GAX91697.1 butanediol dehydrogenase [Effusibacillus lacus]